MTPKQKEIIAFAKKRGMKTPQWERISREDDVNYNRRLLGLKPLTNQTKPK